MLKERCRFSAIVAVAVVSALAAPATLLGQDLFPSRPLRIIVAYTPGTGSDVVARIVGDALAPIVRQPVIVENKPGAGGMLGTEVGAKAPPDGYTLTLASAGALIIAPAMSRSGPRYKVEDFVPIGGLARSAFVVVTANSPESPKTFQELVTRTKEKGGTFGSPGTGTTTHLVGEVLLRQAGVKAVHVPYRGSAQAMSDTAGGQVGFAFDTVAAALPLVRSDKLRALAVSSPTRIASLPGVPTLSEGGLPGFSIVSWWGLLAPAGTPPNLVNKLSDALIQALESAEVKSKLALQELEPYPLKSADFGSLIQAEQPMWINLVKENKLVSD